MATHRLHGLPSLSTIAVLIVWVLHHAAAYEYYLGYNTWQWARQPDGLWRDSNKGNVDAVMADAQRLGVKVIRSWALGKQLPSGPGLYPEDQFRGLDYFVDSAGRHGRQLILVPIDYWAHFIGPGQWIGWAEEKPSDHQDVQFYSSSAVRKLLKAHIDIVLNRRNTYNGRLYKDDPAIMGWDVTNEPRCRGCDASQQSVRHAYLTDLAAYLHKAAPNQLVFSGTEGYFQGNMAKYNPGYGSTCEGEDWITDNSIPGVQVATAHFYFNEVWGPQQLGGRKLSWPEYLNYMVQKIDIHTQIAGQIGKPWMIEEFGEPYHDATNNHSPEDRKMLYAVVYEKLIAAKLAGKPFVGAIFWEAVVDGQTTSDGVGINVDQTPSNPISLGSSVKAPGGAAASAATSTNSSKTTTAGDVPRASSPPAAAAVGQRRLLLAEQLAAGAARLLKRSDVTHSGPTALTRRLTAEGTPDVGQEARSSCALAAIAQYMELPNNLVDVEYYRSLVAGHEVVDIVAAAAKALNA